MAFSGRSKRSARGGQATWGSVGSQVVTDSCAAVTFPAFPAYLICKDLGYETRAYSGRAIAWNGLGPGRQP